MMSLNVPCGAPVDSHPFLRIYGARGSHPAVGSQFAQFGGDTACICAFLPNSLAVFDAGTGLISLGRELQQTTLHKRPIAIFLSHLHFDHVLGLPFFLPVYHPEGRLTIYLPEQMLSHFRALWKQPYCPVDMANVPSAVQLVGLSAEQEICLAPQITMRCLFLGPEVHPKDGIMVYRLCTPWSDVVYATDIEVQDERVKAKIAHFASGAQVMFCDAQYLPGAEYEKHRGWGHNNLEHALSLAELAGVGRLQLFHHEPTRNDTALEQVLSLVGNKPYQVSITKHQQEVQL